MRRHRPQPGNLLAFALALAVLAAPDPVHADPTPVTGGTVDRVGLGTSPLVTFLNYFDAGQRRAERYLTGRRLASGIDYAPLVESLRDACVRVSLERYGADGTMRGMELASGVLVAGGRRVVTAGHAIDRVEHSRIRVTLRDGRSYQARLVENGGGISDRNDWAVLELSDRPQLPLPSIPLGAGNSGDLGLILGYPDRIGLDDRGHAAHGLGRENGPLAPLLFVGEMSRELEDELEPLAGSIPVGGASGGPVFSERGQLLGVLVSVGRLAYPEGIRHSYRMAPAESFGSAVESP